MGLAFGWLVIATGSIWLAVGIHVLIDARFALIPARQIARLEAEPVRAGGSMSSNQGNQRAKVAVAVGLGIFALIVIAVFVHASQSGR
jgi:membrane protease YdiL (CAAX protease family)